MTQKPKEEHSLKNNKVDDDILEVVKQFINYFDELDKEEESDYSSKRC